MGAIALISQVDDDMMLMPMMMLTGYSSCRAVDKAEAEEQLRGSLSVHVPPNDHQDGGPDSRSSHETSTGAFA